MKLEIQLIALWIALMFAYLLGDVLRLYAGDFQINKVDGITMKPIVWLGIALLMSLPIFMIILNAFVSGNIVLYINIIASVVLFLFNAVGLPSYKVPYDIFLIIVGLVLNLVIIWLCWQGL